MNIPSVTLKLPANVPAPQPIPHTCARRGENINELDNGNYAYVVTDEKNATFPIREGKWFNEECLTGVESSLAKKFDIPDLAEILNDPATAKTHALSDYQQFLKEAQAVTGKLKAMDTTNSLTIRFGISGVSVQFGDNVSIADREVAKSDQSAIRDWVNQHQDDIKSIGSKGVKYAISQAYIDYSDEVGCSRHDSIYSDKNEEYIGMVERYAINGFGTNAMSYKEITAMCGKGYSLVSSRSHSSLLSSAIKV